MSNKQNGIDMCKTLIGKVASSQAARTLNGFIGANNLNTAF